MPKQKYLTISIILITSILLTVLSYDVLARPLEAVAPGLGTVTSFAVLGGSTVTNTGFSVVRGDLGVSPGTAVTGFPPGFVIAPGIIYDGTANAVAAQAQHDVTTAYTDLKGQSCDSVLTGVDLGGLTLTPGVYCFSSSAELTGTLTLDAQGDPNSVFVFQIGSALTTASNSSVRIINGGSTTACNVFWQIGSSATLGTTTAFQGNILALTSITLNTGADILTGRALARNGAVTMDTNKISMAVCGVPITPSTATLTAFAATQSLIAPTLTSIALTPSQTLPPPMQTAIAQTISVIAATRSVIAPSLTALAATIAPSLTAKAATQTATARTPTPTKTAKPTEKNTAKPGLASTNIPEVLPNTGFAPQRVTVLSAQPAEKAYFDLGYLWLEIPRLTVQMPIMGVPQTNGQWDVSWLGNQAGWLYGTAFPTYAGNSVLTGHVYDANGKPGPFVGLNTLLWGDKVVVHAWGTQYIYEVREVMLVGPKSISSVIKHEDLPWVTLISCSGYDEASNSYKYRTVVRAVLMEVQ
jgi:LPXTG-site transpeptidase (sortase) family protein